MKKFSKHFLFLILLLAFFLRVYKISENPPSLNWDEVSHGYNAYSILKTGKDEWGNPWPLIFRAYGDYKLPLYIYLTVPFVGLLGLNPFSVRLVSILSGVGLVFLSYLLTRKIAKDDFFSLFAAFLTAISPWSLFTSRIALEANLGAFLFALGNYFLISFLDQPKNKNLFFSLIAWGFSLYAYNSARALAPIMILIIISIAFKKKMFKKFILPGSLFLFLMIPFFFQLFDQSAKARYSWVSLINQGSINAIVEKRLSSKFSPILTRILYNRPVYFISQATINYLKNLSPNYLFFKGGTHYQFSLPYHELLYLVTAPFLILGLFFSFCGGKKERFLVVWFFSAFIPSAITTDAPHVLRGIFVLPAPMILIALGIKELNEKIKNHSFFKGRLIMIVLMIGVILSFIHWWNDYQKIYPFVYSWAWQYGYKEAVLFTKENFEKYNQIIVTKKYGEPHEFFLFYLAWDPNRYQNDQNKKWNFHDNWYWIDSFDKFRFYNDWEFSDLKCEKNCLLIASPGNYPEGWNKIKTITFLDGKLVFEILEKNKK